MPTPSFINLWNGYPTVASPCDGPWGNQCAIRMSVALNTEMTIKINKSTYSEPKCAHEHARGAESLANWLWKNHLGRPKIYTDNVNGKKTYSQNKGLSFLKTASLEAGKQHEAVIISIFGSKALRKVTPIPQTKHHKFGFGSLHEKGACIVYRRSVNVRMRE